MKKFAFGFMASFILLLATALVAQNQGLLVTGATLVQQSAVHQDVATFMAQTNGAVNTNATTTIPAQPGQYININFLQITVCTNGTGTAQNQVSFTSTNLPGTPSFVYSVAATASICQHVFDGPVNWKALIPGTAVTFVPPAAATNNSYQVIATGNYTTQ